MTKITYIIKKKKKIHHKQNHKALCSTTCNKKEK